MKPRTDKDKLGDMEIYAEVPRVVFGPKDIEIHDSGSADLGFFLKCFSPVGYPEQTKKDVILGLKLLNDLRDYHEESAKMNKSTQQVLEDLIDICTQKGVIED